jgi:hypothetical protein
VESAGAGQPHENWPHYYVLTFIMYKGFSVRPWTYLYSCGKAERSGDILQAECRKPDGSWTSKLDLSTCRTDGDIPNMSGQLA